MSEIQAEYPRENGHNGHNGYRENGLHNLHMRDDSDNLKLRLTNGYDIAKLTGNRIHNGYVHQEDVKPFQPNSPSPNVENHDHSPEERKVRGRKRGSQKNRGDSWNNEVFDSKADLQLHTQIHMREAKPYKCTQCTKSFANSSYLSQHTRIHLGIKPYRCEICQRKFTQLSHLQQHIRTHTGDKPYRCKFNTCSKAFSQLSNLQSHSRCHQQDKPFKCNSCYKCFVDENSLLEHIPKHRESKHLKTHICPYCGKSYTQETYLTKHMSKHSERSDKRSPILGLGLNRNEYWKEEPLAQENLQQHYIGDHHLLGLTRDRPLKPNEGMNGNVSDDESIVIRNNANLINDHMSYDIKNNVVTSNSAFTPINQINYTMNRSYIPYDGLNFQNKALHLDLPGNKGNVNNSVSFPNNLISLHQIRNYQPTSSLLTNEHNLLLKDK